MITIITRIIKNYKKMQKREANKKRLEAQAMAGFRHTFK